MLTLHDPVCGRKTIDMVIFALRKFTGKPFSVIKFLKRIFYSVFRGRPPFGGAGYGSSHLTATVQTKTSLI